MTDQTPQPCPLPPAKLRELASLCNSINKPRPDNRLIATRIYAGELRELLAGYRTPSPAHLAEIAALRAERDALREAVNILLVQFTKGKRTLAQIDAYQKAQALTTGGQ